MRYIAISLFQRQTHRHWIARGLHLLAESTVGQYRGTKP
jgi:hypothetical protein